MARIVYILSVFLALQDTSVLSVHVSSRIAGGKDAFPGQYPYQASIQYRIPPINVDVPICGGAILNEVWILTSASCLSLVPKLGQIRVKGGLHELGDDDEWVQSVQVTLQLVNADYEGDNDKAIKPNDIALLKLSKPLVLNERVQPIALPQADEQSQGNAQLTGWGSISKNVIPQLPDVLQVANVSLISEANCNVALASLTDNEKLAKNQLCSGPLAQEISACTGDLGDPLVQGVNDSSVLIGVTSWSPYPCGQAGSPTIYTQVSAFVDWISQRIEENLINVNTFE